MIKHIITLSIAITAAFVTLHLTRPPSHQPLPIVTDNFVFAIDPHVTAPDDPRAVSSAIPWLDEIIPSFDLNNAALDEFVQSLQTDTHQNIFVNWPALTFLVTV